MNLDRVRLLQDRVDFIVSHLRHMELVGKENLFGKDDLIRQLHELTTYLDRLKARELKLPLEDYSMNIEFETYHTKHLTFDMVDAGGLFVDRVGCLFQKAYGSEDDETDFAWMICNAEGEPKGITVTFYPDEKIDRILPKIKRISF